MKRIEVLVATMGQTDISLVTKMNIQSNVIIANQSDYFKVETTESEHGIVKMITTPTKGVGLNRNIALMAAEAEIVLFADDDIYYYDKALQGVVDAFIEFPQADVIAFSVDITKNGVITEKRRSLKKRRHIFNALRYGTCVLAARRSSLLKNNIVFNQLFGGGCLFSSGEDSKFLCDCFRNGLKIYSHSHVLGMCAKDDSSWFQGYNKKFFYDKGILVACLFPRIRNLIKWYFVLRFRKRTDLSVREVLIQMNRGIKNSKRLVPYNKE